MPCVEPRLIWLKHRDLATPVALRMMPSGGKFSIGLQKHTGHLDSIQPKARSHIEKLEVAFIRRICIGSRKSGNEGSARRQAPKLTSASCFRMGQQNTSIALAVPSSMPQVR